jgi:antirestriction protein ArdC
MKQEEKKNSWERYSDYVHAFSANVELLLERGQMPWQRPWTPSESMNSGMPYNGTTGKAYSGMNALYLSTAQMMLGYQDDRWLTFQQANSLGAHVRKGEKGLQLVKWVDIAAAKNAESDDQKSQKMLKPVFFTVFNASQIEGLAAAPVREPKPEQERHAECERLIADSGAKIVHGGNRAFYHPASDTIRVPDRDQFKTPDGYYATVLHELGHWTGHESRLGRDLSGKFGSEDYGREELRAEIASFMIGQRLGIGHDPTHHAAYLQSWLKVIREDPKAILKACNDAEKICEHLGVHKYEHKATQAAENTQEKAKERGEGNVRAFPGRGRKATQETVQEPKRVQEAGMSL